LNYLTVIRHAEAENQHPGGDDAARRLTEAGVTAAFRLGELLAGKDCVLDLLISSPAQRARETAGEVCRALNLGDDIVKVDPELYIASEIGVLEKLGQIPKEIKHLCIVGHNPTLTDLVNSMCGPVVKNMRPGSAACIKLKPPSPEDTGISDGSLVFYIES
jgi:phosphohistidine phosphatase